ncbi:hypothetical protein J0X14_12075 [Muricauda sp. CAU 1633]|uniref:hypothetical protein n=1 Tax=Allomuricauda sp. CAU 1633 TaxID=2816036 RepID=UPI001A8C2BED|nr:hypothetical protein [Muricauda sp. CAU 1633]MBO0323036.1 hypothetical protein [Muricauda sp. CAU 1633]
MLDFLKVIVKDPDEIEFIWNNDKLIFHDYREKLNHFDWETLITKSTKKYKGTLFCRHESKIEILIRPGYLHNDNVHNAGKFSPDDCIGVLKNLLDSLGITSLEHYHIVNIEFGLNLIIPGYDKEIIHFVEYWKRTRFKNDDELAFSKKAYKEQSNGTANTYKIVKLYSKGLQHPDFCPKETIRFEIKSKQSKYINQLGVKTIRDLFALEPYKVMSKELKETSTDILFLDQSVSFEGLDGSESIKLKDFLNTYTWHQTINEGHRNTFAKRRASYNCLLDKAGKNIHKVFSNQVAFDLDNLITNEAEICANSTTKKMCAYSTYDILGISTLGISTHGKRTLGICTQEESKREDILTHNKDLDNSEIWKTAISEKQHMRNNNWVMAHLHELGVKTTRNDTLQRAVRTLISKDYSNPRPYFNAITRIVRLLSERYGIELSENQLMKLASKSRKQKGKKIIGWPAQLS